MKKNLEYLLTAIENHPITSGIAIGLSTLATPLASFVGEAPGGVAVSTAYLSALAFTTSPRRVLSAAASLTDAISSFLTKHTRTFAFLGGAALAARQYYYISQGYVSSQPSMNSLFGDFTFGTLYTHAALWLLQRASDLREGLRSAREKTLERIVNFGYENPFVIGAASIASVATSSAHPSYTLPDLLRLGFVGLSTTFLSFAAGGLFHTHRLAYYRNRITAFAASLFGKFDTATAVEEHNLHLALGKDVDIATRFRMGLLEERRENVDTAYQYYQQGFKLLDEHYASTTHYTFFRPDIVSTLHHLFRPHTTIDSKVHLALHLIQQKSFTDANTLFAYLSRTYPDDFRLACIHASFLESRGDFQSAQFYFSSALDHILPDLHQHEFQSLDGHTVYHFPSFFPHSAFVLKSSSQTSLLQEERRMTEKIRACAVDETFTTPLPLGLCTHQGTTYYAMTYTTGKPLADVVRRDGPTALHRVADKLAKIHEQLPHYFSAQKIHPVALLEERISSHHPVSFDLHHALVELYETSVLPYVYDLDAHPDNFAVTSGGKIISFDHTPRGLLVPPSFELAKLLFQKDLRLSAKDTQAVIHTYARSSPLHLDALALMQETYLAAPYKALSFRYYRANRSTLPEEQQIFLEQGISALSQMRHYFSGYAQHHAHALRILEETLQSLLQRSPHDEIRTKQIKD